MKQDISVLNVFFDNSIWLVEFCEVKIYYFCCTLQNFSRIFVLYDPIKLGKLYIGFLIIIISKKMLRRSFPLDKMWYKAPLNSMRNGLAILNN